MKCYLCDKKVSDDKSTEFVCICNKCFISMEKNEARLVEMNDRLAKLLNLNS